MKNTLLFFSLILFAACYNHDAAINKPLFKADLDTAYSNGSGISTISPDSVQLHNLTNLGMLWGFLKYYHAGVNKGNYNMDAELFRILPKVLAANDISVANTIMEQWVDHFGTPDTCKFCTIPDSTSKTKLMPDYGYLFQPDNFPVSLRNKLEFIKRNRGDTSTTHYYVEAYKDSEHAGNPIFTHERTYTNCVYPDAGLRLLALYRYWNMIQYFYPDRHLIGENWNEILVKFIPIFCSSRDTLSYQLACMQLIASIHDTHGYLLGDTAIEAVKGEFYCPFESGFVEGKLVITSYNVDSVSLVSMVRPLNTIDPNSMVRPGDIIEQIDGIAVSDLVAKYRRLTPASNDARQLHDLASPGGWLLRGRTPDVTLHIMRDGKPFDVVIHRPAYWEAAKKKELFPYGIMKENIGYISPDGLTDASIDSIKILFKNTRGIIVDMRCYPNTMMQYTYGEWLKPKISPYTVISTPCMVIPGRFDITYTVDNGSETGNHYKGKLVIIVNAETGSSAELATMALSSVPGSIVLGSTTAGADGNISIITLPGGLKTYISGIGVLYPDGSESQRVGVKIDKIITPTIKGIKEGRDEQLEYAIKWINGKL